MNAECSMAGRGEIVEDVALLLTQSIRDGEHAFDEAASGLCVPKLVCRHRTPWRRALSASLLVGSTRSMPCSKLITNACTATGVLCQSLSEIGI